MRIATLTNVADDSRTMLISGLTLAVAVTTAGSHQCSVGHIGAANRFLPQGGSAPSVGAPQKPLFLRERLARARG